MTCCGPGRERAPRIRIPLLDEKDTNYRNIFITIL
jgi:hypothetical protein